MGVFELVDLLQGCVFAVLVELHGQAGLRVDDREVEH